MSKIEVPQEQQEKIIDLYVNKQYGIHRVKTELKLPFSDNVVKRVLKENGVHIRNLQEASMTQRIYVPKDLEQQIVDLYKKGYGQQRIVDMLQLAFSSEKVKQILIDNNIQLRTIKEAYETEVCTDLRKYPINDDYKIESHNGAWLLGFCAADGYLPNTKGAKNKIVIALQRRDEDILHMIAEDIDYHGPIYQYDQYLKDKAYPTSCLSFNSKKLRKRFEEYGVVNNKTFKFSHIPDLPQEYKIDFIRGFFDGDGSICLSKEKKTGREKVISSFTSANENLLKEISDFLHNYYGLGERNIYKTIRTHIIYNITYFQEDTRKLGEIFYNNDYLSLPRKKEKYFEIFHKKISPTSLDTP